MLIKIIKLFGALTPLEPRLGKKLIEPLTNLVKLLVLLSSSSNPGLAVVLAHLGSIPVTS